MHLVVFDIDGTLTNTNQVDAECYTRAFHEEFGIAIGADWRGYRHRTDSGIAMESFERALNRAPIADEIDRFRRRFLGLLEQAGATRPELFAEVAGASAAIARLRREPGRAVAIATGCWKASAMLKLGRAGIQVDGVAAAFADDAVARADIVRIAISRSEACCGKGRFARITCVGDTEADVAAASSLGLGFVGVGSERRLARLRVAGASHVIPDYLDFESFCRALSEAAVPPAR